MSPIRVGPTASTSASPGRWVWAHPITFYDGPFTVESTCRIIEKYGITNLTGSPTAYRLLIAAGEAFASKIKGRCGWSAVPASR